MQFKGESRLFLARFTLSFIIKCQLPGWFSPDSLSHYLPSLTLFPLHKLPNYTSFFLASSGGDIVWGKDIAATVQVNTIWTNSSVLCVYSLVLFFSFNKQTEMLKEDEHHLYPRLSVAPISLWSEQQKLPRSSNTNHLSPRSIHKINADLHPYNTSAAPQVYKGS